MKKETARIEELKTEIVKIVIDFALQNPQIQSPLVIRGLELSKLKKELEEKAKLPRVKPAPRKWNLKM